MSKAELSSRRLPCQPHIRRNCIPTIVPHSGRESPKEGGTDGRSVAQTAVNSAGTPSMRNVSRGMAKMP